MQNKALHSEQARRAEILDNPLFSEEETNKYLKKIKNLTDELTRVTQQVTDKEKLIENNTEKITQLTYKISAAQNKYDSMKVTDDNDHISRPVTTSLSPKRG